MLTLVFIAITLQGMDWGIQGGWNPDEIVQDVVNALHGNYIFDETDFLYPSLPKYVMYGLGSVVLGLGFGDQGVVWAARLLSVFLGAGVIALTFILARRNGTSLWFSFFASLLVFTNSILALNARFAHNDIYLTFFILLSTWTGLRYAQTNHRSWFYLTCLLVGLAASSKYNGVALLLLPLALFFILEIGKKSLNNWLRSAETLFLGLILTGLGFAAGTPKALLWMTFYFKRMIPEFISQASYGRTPNSSLGVLGQWSTWGSVLGLPVAILALLAFGYAVIRLIRRTRNEGMLKAAPDLVIPLAILAMDLPILFSYIYVTRYFLPMVPLLAVLCGQLVESAFLRLKVRKNPIEKWGVTAAVVAILGFSFLRVIGVMLLFENDARRPAGEFISQLPAGKSIEFTFYRPYFNREMFLRAYSYPLFFPKFPGETPPTDDRYEYNTGTIGLAERQPDYLVVDSFTYGRFQDPYVCGSIPAECVFFTDLLAGKTDYQLIGTFEYDLPVWIPAMPSSFLNPDIRVYQLAGDSSPQNQQ